MFASEGVTNFSRTHRTQTFSRRLVGNVSPGQYDDDDDDDADDNDVTDDDNNVGNVLVGTLPGF